MPWFNGSLSKRRGLPPDSVVQTSDEILEDSERLINKYHNSNEGAMTQIALAPCSPFSVSEEVMSESSKLSKKHSVLLHTHLSETEDENSFCLDKMGCRPLDYLEQVGWLIEQTWLAHGIHFQTQKFKGSVLKNWDSIVPPPTCYFLLSMWSRK